MDGLPKIVVLLAVVAVFLTSPCQSQSDLPPELPKLECNTTCATLPSTPPTDHDPFQRTAICRCDAECVKFGDCCRDAPALTTSAAQRQEWRCTKVLADRNKKSIWTKAACKPDWSGSEAIRSKCEDSGNKAVDPQTMVPVTSSRTGVSYWNTFCAVCNDDMDGAIRWTVSLDCSELAGQVNSSYLQDNIELSPDQKGWGIWTEALEGEGRIFVTCGVEYRTGNLSSDYSCMSPISTCDPSWSGSDVEQQCQSYTAVVAYRTWNYRNEHCMMCNNVTEGPQSCGFYDDDGVVSSRSFSFSILMDVNPAGGNIVGKYTLCKGDEVFDPFYKTCRSVLCGVEGYVLRDGKCFLLDDYDLSAAASDGPNGTTLSAQFLGCRKTVLDKGEYLLRPNGNLYAPRYDRDFTPGNFKLGAADSRALVCVVFNASNEISKFSAQMGYVSAVGLGVSISCLVAHLAVFALVPDVRNLSGRNLASLALSLLAAYLCFLLGQLGEVGAQACQALGVTTYYFFLASFFWMSAMAFDVWRTLRVATRELRVSSGSQWRRFFVYCVASWFLPAVVVGLAVFFDARSTGIPEDFRPLFGRHGCWFGQRKALLVFFAGPAAALMLVNVILFASTAVMVIGSTKTSVKRSGSAARRNFSLYVRLSVMMGLSWTLGLVAGYLDIEVLWYLFVVLNTLEGLFIFVAFSCTHKVGTYLRDHVLACAKREPYQRSATLSSGSGYNSGHSTGTTNSGFSRRGSPRSSTNYKRTAPYLGKKTSMDMY
uniref:Putative g protein-coupled receptor n=1 Tax=Ixodes scapularis TaxID=6945 RepID=A0A4D5RHC9_IXOSC